MKVKAILMGLALMASTSIVSAQTKTGKEAGKETTKTELQKQETCKHKEVRKRCDKHAKGDTNCCKYKERKTGEHKNGNCEKHSKKEGCNKHTKGESCKHKDGKTCCHKTCEHKQGKGNGPKQKKETKE